MGALSTSDVVYWLVAGMISVFVLWLYAGGRNIRWRDTKRDEVTFLAIMALLVIAGGFLGWFIIGFVLLLRWAHAEDTHERKKEER